MPATKCTASHLTFNNEIGLKFCGELGSLPDLGRVIIVAVNISGRKLAADIAASKTRYKYGDKMELNN